VLVGAAVLVGTRDGGIEGIRVGLNVDGDPVGLKEIEGIPVGG
jgi:hypothetical protein